MDALPNPLHGHQVLRPGEASNKNTLWLCDGRSALAWLRQAQAYDDVDDTPRALQATAIATALQLLDSGDTSSLHSDDAEDTERWMDALKTIDRMASNLNRWEIDFIEGLLANPPAAFSDGRKATITKIAQQRIGLML